MIPPAAGAKAIRTMTRRCHFTCDVCMRQCGPRRYLDDDERQAGGMIGSFGMARWQCEARRSGEGSVSGPGKDIAVRDVRFYHCGRFSSLVQLGLPVEGRGVQQQRTGFHRRSSRNQGLSRLWHGFKNPILGMAERGRRGLRLEDRLHVDKGSPNHLAMRGRCGRRGWLARTVLPIQTPITTKWPRAAHIYMVLSRVSNCRRRAGRFVDLARSNLWESKR